MGTIQLCDGIWSVGVLNPAMRVFDTVMDAEYGTSYNAYLVRGERIALVETVKAEFFDEYLENILQVADLDQIDYLIMDHNEPDHSGSVARLLELRPDLTVLCSAAGKRFLGGITNREFNVRVVRDGDTLDLGGRTLRFSFAPMLHWADSMFTFDGQTGTAFTCDFLGAHYCEPTMRDDRIKAPAAYEREFERYYDCIFGPFPSYVRDGLAKLPAGTKLVCTSHGPCLSSRLEWAKERYRALSAPVGRSGKTAAVVYVSAYGFTGELARAAADALAADGFAVTLLDAVETANDDCVRAVNAADVVLIGSATINRAAPKRIWDVELGIDAINTKGRAAGAFGAFGWSGEAAPMLHGVLKQLGFSVPEAPYRVNFKPTQSDLDAMADYARAVAALAVIPEPEVDLGPKFVCPLCGYVYDPALGDPDHGVAPGTPFAELSFRWSCPLCGADKGMFSAKK